MKNNNNLIWIDLEMTGLDTNRDHIIEIATIITDSQLHILAEGPVMAIHVEDAILDSMDEWNTRQHAASGLVRRVKDSRLSAIDAEAQTLDFLARYIDPGCSPICGNSICQDRRFLARQMPKLEAFFHYRNLDVSSIKELTNRWSPTIAAGFKKESAHLALSDIKDSIEELKYYREKVFRI